MWRWPGSSEQCLANTYRIVDAAAAADLADFAIVIYNPKSKKRDRQLGEARNIIMAHRDPDAPVGIRAGAKRENQEVRFVPLQALSKAPVGMQTTLFVGGLRARRGKLKR
jgi:precorrin-3B methylase